MSRQLYEALERVAQRFRSERLWGSLAVCWLLWAFAGWGAGAAAPRSWLVPFPIVWLPQAVAVAALATAVVCVVWALRSARDPRWVARRIEQKHPDLKTGLLAAVEEIGAAPHGQLGFLQSAVVREALHHRLAHNWNETVPTRTLRGAQLAHAVALLSLIVALVNLGVSARSQADAEATMTSGADVTDVQVEPGNTELERGTSLLVVARFKGAVPADASLVVENQGQAASRRGMARSLEDPAFAGRVESVESDLSYRVEFEGKSTETYHVRVFEYPELKRTDARLVFPQYTSLAPKTVEDIRHVTVVEGTELTLLCRLNKDVATARLIDAEGKALELTPHAEGSHVYRATLTLSDPRRFRIQLRDREGRSNKLTPEIVANVTRNHPPVVKNTQPAHDVQVSPVEELKLKAELEDDFGLVRHGLAYSMAGHEPREIVFKTPPLDARQARAEQLLDFESLRAIPDQLVTYFFWAEDIGPDGQPRRTSGDMFFAEVRHFEEIFRQGEQPPAGSAEQEGQEGNARAADQLADLQKEIINGTWKLIRRETVAKPSAKLAEDGKVLAESQRSAIEKAAQLAERLRDDASKASLDQATNHMKEAETQLAEVAAQSSVPALNKALAAEQAAYQALLKLRAREFEVIRSNSRRQGGRNSAGNRAQRQLDQLELSPDENRYEEQRTARAQQERLSEREREQAETRQVLSRLRELAQRQMDVNERLKELQSALEAAKTPQARQEIERQLKRLREQEQQILRDADELRERMEREENRARMAEARQQMEEGREHLRQASDALEQGRVPQALTEGTRAGRQLSDLRDELRKGASNRFSEEMTDMREQARRLNDDQEKLTQQLEAASSESQHSLRETSQRKGVRAGLEQQEKRLEELLEQMKRTVQDAEETEPLLAKGLYDTVRNATEDKIPDALKTAEQLVDLGVNEGAAKESRQAGRGIERMKTGVERAARSVLGDETAALRRAQGELEDLAEQINREIAQATGSDPAQTLPRGQRAPDQEKGRRGQQGSARDPRNRQNRQGQTRQGAAPSEPGKAVEPERQGERGQPGNRGAPPERGQPGERNQQGQAQQQGEQGGQGGQQGQPGQPRPNRLRGGAPPDGTGARQAGSPNGGGSDDRFAVRDPSLDGLPRGPGGPITGNGFREWSDRMRDVEELLDDPELRAQAARIRDRARGEREEYKRHSKEPDWNRLKDLVAEPINELRDRIAEEVRRRESPDSLVPIDRDPVPPQFAEGVRRYYERLGSGR
jgi:hypothetical protein